MPCRDATNLDVPLFSSSSNLITWDTNLNISLHLVARGSGETVPVVVGYSLLAEERVDRCQIDAVSMNSVPIGSQ